MNDVIFYGSQVPTSVLLKDSFSTHIKLSKVTFSLFLPALIDLEKCIQKWESQGSPKTVMNVLGEIAHSLKKKSGKWLSGVFSCCLHTTAALCLSKMENAVCQRAVFLYRLHPKLSTFFARKLIKTVLPERFSKRFFKKKIVDEDQARYVMNVSDYSLSTFKSRLNDSILRRGIYACADLTVHLIRQRISFNFVTSEDTSKKPDPVALQDIKYAILYHGGALCAGSLGGLLGYWYASNEGEYWCELLASFFWMKWMQKY